jgi:hypothetical protein
MMASGNKAVGSEGKADATGRLLLSTSCHFTTTLVSVSVPCRTAVRTFMLKLLDRLPKFGQPKRASPYGSFPPEILLTICLEACSDGRTASSLRHVSRAVKQLIDPYRFRYICVSGDRSLQHLCDALDAAPAYQLNNAHHAFVSDVGPWDMERMSWGMGPWRDEDHETLAHKLLWKVLERLDASLKTLTLVAFSTWHNPTAGRWYILRGLVFPQLYEFDFCHTGVSRLTSGALPNLRRLSMHIHDPYASMDPHLHVNGVDLYRNARFLRGEFPALECLQLEVPIDLDDSLQKTFQDISDAMLDDEPEDDADADDTPNFQQDDHAVDFSQNNISLDSPSFPTSVTPVPSLLLPIDIYLWKSIVFIPPTLDAVHFSSPDNALAFRLHPPQPETDFQALWRTRWLAQNPHARHRTPIMERIVPYMASFDRLVLHGGMVLRNWVEGLIPTSVEARLPFWAKHLVMFFVLTIGFHLLAETPRMLFWVWRGFRERAAHNEL